MRVSGKHLNLAVALALAMQISGCKKEDPQRLSAVGKKVAEKVNTSIGEARGKGLLKFSTNETAASRVVLRMRWDSALADTNIEVAGTGGEVEIRGDVPTHIIRQHAIDVAQSTVGVEHVHADKLFVTPGG